MSYRFHLSRQESVPSEEIIARLDPAVPLQAAHIQAIRELEKHGVRYSNEDGDVLSAAWRAIGVCEVKPWEAGWVAAMARRAAEWEG